MRILHYSRIFIDLVELAIRLKCGESAELEWEIDRIIAETRKKQGNRQIPLYHVCYTGFGPEDDWWVPRSW